MTDAVVLKCDCCGLPWLRVVNGCLVVQSVHHGERHRNVVALDELVRLYQESQRAPQKADSVAS